MIPGTGIAHPLFVDGSGAQIAGLAIGGATHMMLAAGIIPHPTATTCPLTVPVPPDGWPGKR